MRVLMITGDKNLLIPGTEAYSRLALQKSVVPELEVVYWGHGSVWPVVPQGHFDVVTVQDPFWRGLFGWYVARKKRARFNVQIHVDLRSQNYFRYLFARAILRRADSVRVVSERIQEQVKKYTRAPILKLPVFIDEARFHNLQPQPHAQKTILWIGRFETEKDPLSMLRIYQDVRREGVDVCLIMLGSGSLERKLREMAKDFEVVFPGWQDTALFYPQADVVVSTSCYESWGASIVEALSAGVPVVSLDVGVAREAGAFIAEENRLTEKIIEILTSGVRGELKLVLPTAKEWAQKWKESLS